ncbi:MAG: hypothetical protein V4662_02990 [Verrucomicrobiota bacterium]
MVPITPPTTFLKLSAEEWQAISAIGTILSSFFAAWAVWMSRRQTEFLIRPSLQLTGSTAIIPANADTNTKEFKMFVLGITNIGSLAVTIYSVWWEAGCKYLPFKMTGAFLLSHDNPSDLTHKVQPSDNFTHTVAGEKYDYWVEYIAEKLSHKPFIRWYARRVRFGFHLAGYGPRLTCPDAKFCNSVLTRAIEIRGLRRRGLRK